MNIDKKYFFAIVLIGLIFIGIVGVIAYNSAGTGGTPSVFGHSVDEIEWSQTITKNVTAAGFCMGGVCKTDWTVTGFVDTKCNVSGSCSQVCIGSDCKTSWPLPGDGGGGGSQWQNQTGTNNIYYNYAGGNVGIGTATPSAKLDVNGTIVFTQESRRLEILAVNEGEDTVPAPYGTFYAYSCDNSADSCDHNCQTVYSPCSLVDNRTCTDIFPYPVSKPHYRYVTVTCKLALGIRLLQ